MHIDRWGGLASICFSISYVESPLNPIRCVTTRSHFFTPTTALPCKAAYSIQNQLVLLAVSASSRSPIGYVGSCCMCGHGCGPYGSRLCCDQVHPLDGWVGFPAAILATTSCGQRLELLVHNGLSSLAPSCSFYMNVPTPKYISPVVLIDVVVNDFRKFGDPFRYLLKNCFSLVTADYLTPGRVYFMGLLKKVIAFFLHTCLFISYRASIYGFITACRPLLELDKAELKGKYLGALLCAAAVDADDALFPLAIAIVDVESDENWMWFMSELRKLLGVNTENIPRLSERQRGIVDALATWFTNHREMGMRWTSILVPSAEKRISEAIADARCYQVLRANEVEFEIVSTERTNIVDIRSRVCCCRRWQLYGLPCAHAADALISCGQNAHLFAEPCFTVGSYRETYSQMMHTIPDKSV
ncbi:sterol 3-beta-glucosyltransferase UGT80A2-like isoform X1 [Hibiscus syriacus]|uniref:Sterol 3-beta-glucosyltransferase UGT80A2-like isoform X1 n=1 Tax=Hibiscus syriacus TaxID=106335 RepID=A0A6A3ACS9_HIBSY|nr:sterol 3-beta-glucosyltransferase UGT80A2-like isoform X1 [Hibiscus syriacus]